MDTGADMSNKSWSTNVSATVKPHNAAFPSGARLRSHIRTATGVTGCCHVWGAPIGLPPQARTSRPTNPSSASETLLDGVFLCGRTQRLPRSAAGCTSGLGELSGAHTLRCAFGVVGGVP